MLSILFHINGSFDYVIGHNYRSLIYLFKILIFQHQHTNEWFIKNYRVKFPDY